MKIMKAPTIRRTLLRWGLAVVVSTLFLMSQPPDSRAMDPGCKDPKASEVTATISPSTGNASTPITITVSFRWTLNAPQECLDQNLIFDFGYYNFNTSPMAVTIEEVSVKSNGQNVVSKSITRTPTAFNLKGSTSFNLGATIENGWNGVGGRLAYGEDVVAFKGVKFTLDKPIALIDACIADNDKYSCNVKDPSCAGKSTIQIDVSLCGHLSKIWACVANDSKYACSPGNKSDLSDTVDPGGNNFCKGKTPTQIQEFLCGSKASVSSGGCGGYGQPICPVSSTESKTYNYSITNPLAGSPNDLFGIINVVTNWIIYLSVPLAVLFIMWAGFLMLTAGPTPARFNKGRDILKYVVLGLSIIFIGKGFVSLVISIIELGGTTSSQTSPAPGTSAGSLGWSCSKTADCNSGLKCQDSMCANTNGNVAGEPCLNNQCAQGFLCDNSPSAQKTIDGKKVGTCSQALCQPKDPYLFSRPEDYQKVCVEKSATSTHSCEKTCASGSKAGTTCYSSLDCQ